MNLRQQIIQERTEEIAQIFNLNKSDSFLRLTHSLIVGQSIHSFDPNDIVDGGQDKQIDVISFEEDGDQATVYITQAKNEFSFSSNTLIQMHNGLNWIFTKPRSNLNQLGNNAFRDKILEYRSLLSGIGPSNIRIIVTFVTLGLTSELSDEFKQEVKAINDEYDNDTFAEFKLEIYGADELVGVINAQERQNRRIDDSIKIKYDANNPSLIKYYSQDLKGIVCSAPASEIARLVNNDPDGSIFDLNIRRFLGTNVAVNKDIYRTCSSTEFSYQFWFLNNGITILCDDLDPVTDPDNPHIKLKNMQIVNGCQTATTLALAQRENKLPPDVRVLLRVYETNNPDLVNKVVLTTNNQNKISGRDLRANDPVQIDMEKAFSFYSYYYERKPRQFTDVDVDALRIITNELVAQAYLAIIMKTPSDARRRKYKVWGELYNKIFSGQAVQPYIIAVLITRYTSNWLRDEGYTNDENDITRRIAKNAVFHIARITAFLWRGHDNWRIDQSILDEQLSILERDITLLHPHLEKALTIIMNLIINDNDYYFLDLDTILKSYLLDEDITRRLHVSQ